MGLGIGLVLRGSRGGQRDAEGGGQSRSGREGEGGAVPECHLCLLCGIQCPKGSGHYRDGSVQFRKTVPMGITVQ
ncbi:hypothetical protein NUTIK01_03780 [Novosphingobium sp. IK01]|uniref:4Fe-4S ferredoxin-type domain-containing protein n=1 Tax=Novosphingobium pituita TaxID=3056842 RepID=A0ABQ6P349_9SPHN|nr:hypothetical protein NUTIK01_03780 [Novosphingobium sp. IK01]